METLTPLSCGATREGDRPDLGCISLINVWCPSELGGTSDSRRESSVVVSGGGLETTAS